MLWDVVNNLWKNGKSFRQDVQTPLDYWSGKYEAPSTSLFKDQKKTSCNICKEIAETKLASMLDSPYTIAVLPDVNVFANLTTIKDQQAYADILHAEMQNILKDNKWDTLKEKIARWGVIKVGAVQPLFEDNKVKLKAIDPREIKIDGNAKQFCEATWVGYESEMNPSILKEKFAKDANGVYNEELCKKIDMLSSKSENDTKGKQKGITAYQDSSNNNSGLAYARERGGIVAGKTIKIITMYLIDDTAYVPDDKDTQEIKDDKIIYTKKYPNGRLVMFNSNETHKLVLEDRPAPKGFKGLANIELFGTSEFDGLLPIGEIDDIIPIQDRINGSMLKIRQLIGSQINSLVLDKGLDIGVQEGDVVNHMVLFLDNGGNRQIPVINNLSVEQAMKLIEYIAMLKADAYSIARLNETMINGTRQIGTTSGEQVEQLNESPMASIRAMQDNFKTFITKLGEKILVLIQEYYTTQRLFEVSTGIYANGNSVKYAQMVFRDDQQYLEMLDDCGRVIQQIKTDPTWKFKVEVTAGNEIPRSRRENAMLMEKLYTNGTLGDQNDLDIKEQYLLAQDIPNARAFIAIQKRKQEELLNNPPKIQLTDVLQDPNVSKAVSDFIKALEFNSSARDKVLETLGFTVEEASTDTLETAPVQAVASKADIKEVTAIEPNNASDNPAKQAGQQDLAAAMIDQHENKQKSMPIGLQ